MKINYKREKPKPCPLPPVTSMAGFTSPSYATISATFLEDEHARGVRGAAGARAEVQFGELGVAPMSQYVGALDCDDLIEFFTKLRDELRNRNS